MRNDGTLMQEEKFLLMIDKYITHTEHNQKRCVLPKILYAVCRLPSEVFLCAGAVQQLVLSC
jgi:hypothetical protein